MKIKILKNLKSITIIFSIFVFMLIAYTISMSFFEPKAYNFMVQNYTAHKSGSDNIVIITIDDKSLTRIRWPWKRELYGKIFEYLNKYSMAKLIGFDAIIATPDVENPKSDEIFYSSIKNIDNLVVGFAPLETPYNYKIPRFDKYNGVFKNESSKSEGINYDKIFKNKFSISIKDKRTKKPYSSYQSLSKFPMSYFYSVKKVGSVITNPDSDGYIRSVEQFIQYKDNLYPSLALRMYYDLHPASEFIVKNDSISLSGTNLKIPSFNSSDGVLNDIHYYKTLPNSEYSHKTYSAIDIMDSLDNIKHGKKPLISPQVFEDKIVLVGANAKAIAVGLTDVKRTPISSDAPGVDIQATNLDNILHNEFIVQSTIFQDVVTCLTLLIITFLVIMYFPLFISLGIIALTMIAYIAFCVICYRFNLAVNVITPLLLQIIFMTMSYSYRFILEGQKKEKIQNAMGKYISHDVMQSVVKNIDKLKLGGKRANVTVLFADIRGFTAMSEKMTAEEVSVILNEYFKEIEPIISKYDGVINKFIGDAVMAIFGEPIQDKNHAQNAVRCANEMLKKVNELQKKWLEEGKPKIEIGIGINTGEAFVGNIGTETRLEYTVIGDMVNLASRIESYNKVYKTNFLISSTTYEKVRNIADVIKISEVSIRGKAKKLNIYEVLRLV